jgi:hypothetical protein
VGVAAGFLTLRVKVNAKINLEKMDLFLSDKQIDITDSMEEHAIAIKKVAWQERDKALWAGMNLVKGLTRDRVSRGEYFALLCRFFCASSRDKERMLQ